MGKDWHLLAECKDVALVIIDVQERLAPVVQEKDRLIDNVKRLVKFALLGGIPILLTEQENLGPTVPEIKTLLAQPNPISKITFDCFKAAGFVDRIREIGKNTLLIAGIEAHICVLQTALHAVGTYNVHVIADAISSRSNHNKEIALRRMERAGVVISSTEMAIYELMERAGTDLFRKVLPLIK